MKPLAYICFVLLCSSILHRADARREESLGRVNEDADAASVTAGEHLRDHDATVDQEAFLGKAGVKEFEELSPEEARERLKKIIKQIDTNEDGVVSLRELAEWIKNLNDNYYIKDANRRFAMLDTDKDDFITFNEYARSMGLDDDPVMYEDYVERDRVKFRAADEDGDGKLSKTEFSFFMYPEQHQFMSNHVVGEFLEHHDDDHDGSISLKEFTAVYHPHLSAGAGEPNWLQDEKDNFKEHLDKNGDGKLDRDELTAWIIPDDGMFGMEEAEYLMSEADIDKDKQLSELEILDNYQVFVNSRVSEPFLKDEL